MQSDFDHKQVFEGLSDIEEELDFLEENCPEDDGMEIDEEIDELLKANL